MVRGHDAALKQDGSKVEITHEIKDGTAYTIKLLQEIQNQCPPLFKLPPL